LVQRRRSLRFCGKNKGFLDAFPGGVCFVLFRKYVRTHLWKPFAVRVCGRSSRYRRSRSLAALHERGRWSPGVTCVPFIESESTLGRKCLARTGAMSYLCYRYCWVLNASRQRRFITNHLLNKCTVWLVL
jgi:hypothetical protein